MPGLIIWKNQEINRLKRDMDRLISRLWEDFGTIAHTREALGVPFVYLSETEDTLVIHAEVPGMEPGDLDVSLHGDILTIRAKVDRESIREKDGFSSRETRHGFFSRSLQLPCRVIIDEAQASYKNDVLKIVLPKRKEESTRQVKIQIQ